MKLNTILKFIFLGLFASTTSAQIYADSVKYGVGFQFNEGVYRSRNDFKYNTPSFFGTKIISRDCGSFTDETGKVHKVDSSNFFGYSQNSFVYITKNCYFFRLIKIGAICIGYQHGETISIVDWHPEFNGGTSFPIVREYDTSVMCLYDFNNKKFKPYTIRELEDLIANDEELYDEFKQIKGRKNKRNSIWMYVEKYNQNHPIYFLKTN